MAYWEVFCETLMESAIAFAILLAVYFLIEFVEFKWSHNLDHNHFLQGKASPVLGALVGSVPQCGFSVVASDLFARGIIPVGTLLSIFVATSDEALPMLLAHPSKEKWLSIIILFASKIVIAIVVGYLANWLYRLFYRRPATVSVSTPKTPVIKVAEEQQHEEHAGVNLHDGCCHHKVDGFNWKHPLFHSLKIWAFIFAVSFLFGCVADIWVGHERLTTFLGGSLWLQPLLAVLVGLIPNCAASVVLTEFYLIGGLRFGALLGGLCVNAGLGIIFLLRQKQLWREKIFVITCLIAVSLLAGYGFLWLNI
ncbi:MAG: arsenic efflux protein [Clostridia bacterium]|nr:arsenic efflux protein [Clostridia bacterium]